MKRLYLAFILTISCTVVLHAMERVPPVKPRPSAPKVKASIVNNTSHRLRISITARTRRWGGNDMPSFYVVEPGDEILLPEESETLNMLTINEDPAFKKK